MSPPLLLLSCPVVIPARPPPLLPQHRPLLPAPPLLPLSRPVVGGRFPPHDPQIPRPHHNSTGTAGQSNASLREKRGREGIGRQIRGVRGQGQRILSRFSIDMFLLGLILPPPLFLSFSVSMCCVKLVGVCDASSAATPAPLHHQPGLSHSHIAIQTLSNPDPSPFPPPSVESHTVLSFSALILPPPSLSLCVCVCVCV